MLKFSIFLTLFCGKFHFHLEIREKLCYNSRYKSKRNSGKKGELRMDTIRNYLHAFSNVMQSIGFVDIVDILLLTYLIYVLLKMIRETRAGQLLKGIILLVVAYLLSDFAQLKAINLITEKVLSIGLLALVIIFQPELRRALEKFGQTTFRLSRLTSFGQSSDVRDRWEQTIPIICESVGELSRTNTGALIVIERSTKLGEQISNGTVVNATPSLELFCNIFYPKTPLHDGAVIMRDGLILAAACFLPKPQKEELIDKHLGSRHRAAIGMSENSDAMVLVVSEETGQISIAEDGKLTRDYTPEALKEYLTSVLLPEIPDKPWNNLFQREKPDSGDNASAPSSDAAKEKEDAQ